MNQKIEELARTLVQSGMAASESEAKRMAEEMVSTESKVQEDFDIKKDRETMYGRSPRTPRKEGQGQLNQTGSNPRPLFSDVKTNPVDGTPITPAEQQRPRDNVGMVKVENPHMTPEEYSAAQLNVAKSTSELIEEENMEARPQEEESQEEMTEEVQEAEEPKEAAEELVIPKPDDPIEEPQAEEKKDLPNLNPLDETHEQVSEAAVEAQTQPAQEEPQAEEAPAEEKQMTPEEYTSQNNRAVGSDGKPLPQTQTPNRPEMSKEEKEKMEESKVDLTKIFKV